VTVNSRAKGKAHELWFVKWLAKKAGRPCSRNYDQAASGGNDVNTDLPFSFELKIGAAPRLLPALHQADVAAEEGEYPVAVLTFNQKGKRKRVTVVSMYLEDWGELLGMLTTEEIL